MCELGQISIVVTLPFSARASVILSQAQTARDAHFRVEHALFALPRSWQKLLLKQLDDIFAHIGKFTLDLLALLPDQCELSSARSGRSSGSLHLFQGIHYTPTIPKGIRLILVRDGE